MSSYRLSTACMEMKSAGTLKVSKNTSAAFSLFLLGFRGASVSSTGCWERFKKTQKKKNHRVSGVATSSCVEVREPERSSPPRRMSAAAPWSKRTARSAPCHSSRSRCHAPSGTAPTAGPCAPDGRRRGRVYYSLKM